MASTPWAHGLYEAFCPAREDQDVQWQLMAHWFSAEEDPSEPVHILKDSRESVEWLLQDETLTAGVPLQQPPLSFLLLTVISWTN